MYYPNHAQSYVSNFAKSDACIRLLFINPVTNILTDSLTSIFMGFHRIYVSAWF